MSDWLSGPRSLGKLRSLTRIATQDGFIATLAIDHPENYLAMIDPDWRRVTSAEVTRSKLELVAALAPHASAFLVDPLWSLAQGIVTGVIPRDTGIITGIEALSYQAGGGFGTTTQLRDRWTVEKIKTLGADAVKLVVWWRPDADDADEIRRMVSSVVGDCEHHQIPLVVEPLWYPRDGQDPTGQGAREERVDVVVGAAKEFVELGIDVLKSEFPGDLVDAPGDTTGEEASAQAARAIDAACAGRPWVMLSGSGTYEVFRRQLAIVAEAGACGFMAGRAIWTGAVGGPEERRREAVLRCQVRLDECQSILRAHGRPWRQAPAMEEVAETLTAGWHERYLEP
ncbi:tagatose 1,6-diphosphate aldolase [Pedococcus sp. 5OH_020]|uniref:tagatose 1,6-diphosphate aldolase n=1 Tax=Pedococcus sp. 5OH_020 TaxID=2989814 RepID=UPI0022E9FA42|nr:tagatose 1,6-diphosphate aldolase [Pedococcus sp. 5OH_020]